MDDAGWKGLLELFGATYFSKHSQHFHIRHNLPSSWFSPLTDYFSKGNFCLGQDWSSLLHECGKAHGTAPVAIQQLFPLCELGFLCICDLLEGLIYKAKRLHQSCKKYLKLATKNWDSHDNYTLLKVLHLSTVKRLSSELLEEKCCSLCQVFFLFYFHTECSEVEGKWRENCVLLVKV